MESHAPASIGIIMDGNRRYAKEKGLPALEGHRAGYETLKNVCKWAKEAGVKNVTVFAFSTENWNRKPEEVSYLLDLMRFALGKELEMFKKEHARILYAGDLTKFPKDIQDILARAVEETKHNTDLTLTTCISYGGRDEILRAIKKAAAKLSPADFQKMTEADFAGFLDTAGTPDPDLIIRTSGEERLSGFLAWQGVYSELFFTKTKWPDFSKEEFNAILTQYGERHRRFGK